MHRHTRFGNAFDHISSGSAPDLASSPSSESQSDPERSQYHQSRLQKRHPLDKGQGAFSTPSSRTECRGQRLFTNPVSPWTRYDRLYKALDITGEPFFGVSIDAPNIRVLIRKIPDSDNPEVKERTLFYSQKRHCNIMSIYEAFVTEKSLYLVLEEIVPMCRIIRCPFFPNEKQLIAILGQVWHTPRSQNENNLDHCWHWPTFRFWMGLYTSNRRAIW